MGWWGEAWAERGSTFQFFYLSASERQLFIDGSRTDFYQKDFHGQWLPKLTWNPAKGEKRRRIRKY